MLKIYYDSKIKYKFPQGTKNKLAHIIRLNTIKKEGQVGQE